jgi:hypothetical protein
MSGARTSGRQKVCKVVPNICESPVLGLLNVTFLVPIIQWFPPRFLESLCILGLS